MTGFQRWRKVARGYVVVAFGWEGAVAIAGVVLALIAVGGGAEPSLDRLIAAVATLGVFGVIIWSVRDARRRRARGLSERVATAREDG